MSIYSFGKTFIVSSSWLLVAIACATEGPFHFHLISKNQFSKTLNEESDNIFSRFRFFVKFQMLFLNNSAHSIFFEAKADSQNIVSNVCSFITGYNYPAGIYLFRVNSGIDGAMCEGGVNAGWVDICWLH